MSLPSFPSSPHSSPSPTLVEPPSHGAGDHLPVWLLALCGSFTAVATGVSIMSITLQLKNYRKPSLQRAVVRIMVMVPLYAISSLIAIFSLEAAFFIDAVRDLYEAFVIYTFLQLLITYLGGERSLLIILHGRPPIPHPFPVGLFLRPMDVSDPWVLLNLKRGVLQYVQVKPLLVVATVILKATGTYQEGRFAADSGYTYISIIYNLSICLSLYCLAMFWVAVNKDLKPFRPVPKFLCVKGILFFSFWQAIGVSFLVAVHAIKQVGPYTDAEHMSLALVDSLICFEMPIFAIAHQYAFQASDYIDDRLTYAARLPFVYAFRDAFGFKDVWEDTKDTLKGRGVSYQAYEPAEGGLHYGLGRQRRIRAGLRYSKGGKAKYWVPIPGDEARGRGETGPLAAIKRRVDERLAAREGYAPLLPQQAARVVRDDPDEEDEPVTGSAGLFDSDSEDSDAPSISFHSADEDEDMLYERARRIGYAGFPNVDVSREAKRRQLWAEEEGILAGKWNRGGGREGTRPGLGRQRTSDPMLGHAKGKKGKGKGKDERNKVYGAWADRVSHVQQKRGGGPATTPNGHAINPSGEGEWLYDGEAERVDAWNGNGNGDSGAEQLRWTKKQLGKEQGVNGKNSKPSPVSVSKIQLESEDGPVQSPFSLGDDEEEEECENNDGGKAENDPESPVTPSGRSLPSDAVDLVTEDTNAVEVARARERRRGEPQTNAPAHVYRKTLVVPGSNPEEGWTPVSPNSQMAKNTTPRLEEVDKVYTRSPNSSITTDDNVGKAEAEAGQQEIVENVEIETSIAIEPPRHALSSEVEDNPWA